ncbi:MAG: TonB-dependent receptor [Sphingobacteriales bacterium]|nr:MAG: TonB-dependent receptor [Sphingobacteriales bacterium]
MKKLSMVLCAILLVGNCFAQQAGKIWVTVQNDKNAAIENATATLLKPGGKQLVQSTIADKKGLVVFENIANGTYLIKISATGFTDQLTDSIVISNANPTVNLKSVTMQAKASTDLKAVTVTAKKPFIQRLNDRLVVNVDNSVVNAGSSAFEVLERSPGVTVDNNDNIALRGKQGVIIMIDGKPSPMSGADLVNYLRGLPSNSIDRIEIITNPSSKYDAAGNSGIIDIRLKKDQRMGSNGTFNIGYGQGVYPKANTGVSLNHRNKKVNLFGSYNYGYRKGLNRLYLDRNFYENGVFNGSDLKDNFARMPFNSNSVRAGADFYASKKTVIGMVLNANFNAVDRRSDNKSVEFDSQRDSFLTFNTIARNNDDNNNFVGNINFKHTFDSTRKELTADFDYGVYNSRSLSTTGTQYFKIGGGTLQPDYILDGRQKGKLNFTTARVDYVNPLKNNASFELGLKTSFVSTDNDAKFFNSSNGTPVVDAGKTNHFLYDENNNAAYVNFKKDFKKWDMQLGLRAEQTNIKTYQEIGKVSWDSNYLQLFPTAFFNYKLKEDQTIGISVSRRIDRPGYSQLNPFLFLIDVTTYATGNPGLMPQFTWAYELNYTVKAINISLSYSHTKNNQNVVIARYNDLFPQNPQGNNVTVQIPVNISSSDYAGLSIAAPVKVTKWWNMVNNADIFYNHFNGSLGATKLNNGKPAVDLRVNNSFTLKNGWATELNGVFNSGGQYGFMVSKPQWGISAGVQKTILQGKGTLRFNVTDIFWTNLPRATITYNNYVEKWKAKRETRVANISFSYRFGKKTVQAARRRTTGSEEERQRAGN